MNTGANSNITKEHGGDLLIRNLKLPLLLFPLAFIALLVWLKLNHSWFYMQNFMMEDGPIEYATSIAYFLATIVSAFVSVRLYKNGQRFYCFLYVLLTIGLFLIGGEEISWGQRIFGWETDPFFAEHNIQDETNLHNILGRFSLEGMYIIVGFNGAFSRLLTPSRLKNRFPMALDLLTPNYFLVLFFFPCFALYLYYDYLSVLLVQWLGPQFGFSYQRYGGELFMRAKDQEPIEFLMSLGFFLFVLINCYRYAIGSGARATA